MTATLPAPTGELFPDADEAAPPDTARIQAALNACAGTGQAVVLAASPPSGGPGSGPPDTAFLSAPLTIGNDEYLVIGAGATLYASRNAADYQITGDPACGSIGTSSSGCNAFITVTGVDSGIEGRAPGRTRAASTAAAARTSWAPARPGGRWRPPPPRRASSRSTRG